MAHSGMSLKFSMFSAIVITAAAALNAPAAIMTITQTGIAGGSIGGQAFGTRSFTFTSIADTDQRQSSGTDIFWIEHISSQVTIANIGTFDILIPTRTYVSHSRQFAVYARGGAAGLDLFLSPQSELFVTWDMTTSLGPVSGAAGLTRWSPPNDAVITSGGVLIMNNGPANGTFLATIPSPGPLLMCGAMGVVVVRRRRCT